MAVVGAGRVGSAVANALVLLRVCDRVVIYDRDLALAEGEAWDIADTVPLLSEMEVVPTRTRLRASSASLTGPARERSWSL